MKWTSSQKKPQKVHIFPTQFHLDNMVAVNQLMCIESRFNKFIHIKYFISGVNLMEEKKRRRFTLPLVFVRCGNKDRHRRARTHANENTDQIFKVINCELKFLNKLEQTHFFRCKLWRKQKGNLIFVAQTGQ